MLGKTACGLLLLLILTGGAAAQQQQQEWPSYLDAEHKAVVQRWFKREPKLRLATDKDCGQCDDDIANQRRVSGADYHPYYAVGDFNGDGKTDFAVAAIELESDAEGKLNQKFVVAVFNAPFPRYRAAPAFQKDELNLRDGGLFFGPPKASAGRLFIGLFSNDTGLTLIPHRRRYIAK
jgi:hypothetical protein